MRVLSFLSGVLLLVQLGNSVKAQSILDLDPSGKKLPVTHLRFNNDSSLVQFAILSDRTGGMVPGIFEEAIKKANQLQPQFVLSVGDLINGYSTDSVLINEQWTEFNQLLEPLTVPFFYVSGNHDISNAWMQKEWIRRYGQSHYYFIYRNTLFLILNSQDNGSYGMREEQINYFKKVLADNPSVRWTFLFMHQPMWSNQKSGFDQIETALGNRKYTVIAGHTHNYTLSKRNNRKYYILATSGGGSERRGEDFGEFDHITWVTLRDAEEPKFVHLKLDGIIDENIVTESIAQQLRLLKSGNWLLPEASRMDTNQVLEIPVTLQLHNTNKTPLKISGLLPSTGELQSIPQNLSLTLPPNSKIPFSFSIQQRNGKPIDLAKLAPVHLELQASQEIEGKPYSLSSDRRILIDWPLAIQAYKGVQKAEDINASALANLHHPEAISEDWDWSGKEDLDLRFTLAEDPNFLYLTTYIKDDQFVFQPGEYQDKLYIWIEDKNQQPFKLDLQIDPQKPAYILTDNKKLVVKKKLQLTSTLKNGELVTIIRLPRKDYIKEDGAVRLNIGYYDQDDPTSTEAATLYWKPDWKSKSDYKSSGNWRTYYPGPPG